jgi:hypothetical protein
MIDYSFNLNLDKVYHHKTREYFKDVLSSANIGNNRGAIVLLYSIVICDLLYKLTELKDLFGDQKAIQILDEIEDKQNKDPNSPRWEKFLIEEVYDKTQLLDFPEYTNIKNLQQLRHICAHPIFVNDNILYQPNLETTRAHIRNIYEGLLTKASVRSKEIFDELLKDLEMKRDSFFIEKDLETYLEGKYFRYIRPQLKQKFFKNLWKFVFRLDDVKANINREINYRCLCILFKRNRKLLDKCFENESNYFNEINESLAIDFLINFLSVNPYLYKYITEEKKIVIKNQIQDRIDLQLIFGTLEENITSVIENSRVLYENNIREDQAKLNFHDNLGNLLQLAIEKGHTRLSIKKAIEFYVKSWSYFEADISFELLIYPLLDFFSKDEYKSLLDGIEANSQTYHRRGAKEDHLKVMNKILLKYEDVKLEDYPKFSKSIIQR